LETNKKVFVLTSSFPRYKGDSAGNFVFETSKRASLFGFKMIILSPHHFNSKFVENMEGLDIQRFAYFRPFKYQFLYRDGGILYNLRQSYLATLQVPSFFLSELFNAIKIVKVHDISVIHSHWLLPQGLVGVICKKIFNIPLIISCYGTDVLVLNRFEYTKKIAAYILNNSDRILTESSFTKSILPINKEIIEQKVSVIPMGVDREKFNQQNHNDLKIKFDADHIIFSLGRLVERKGINYLICAMKRVIIEFPRAKLIIGGTGPELENLKNLAEYLDIINSVIFAGFISDSDLPSYYKSSDAFVLPSITVQYGDIEGQGIVLLEAMACGTPVIGTNVGGIASIITNNYNGFLINEKSPEELADRIIQLIVNEELASSFKINGLKEVDKNFSWDIIGEKFAKIYNQISK